MNDFEESVQLVNAFVIAGQTDGKIEAKSVHVHFQDPITQAVHHQLKRPGMQQVKGVACAREIQIEPRLVRTKGGISEIVDAAETECWTEMISFGSMIINNIENHFDAGGVKTAHHRFELDHLFPHLPAAGVLCMRRKKPDRIVTPVIC